MASKNPEKKKITVETEITEDTVRTITTETQEVGLFTRFRFGWMTILAIIVLIVFVPVIVLNISVGIQGLTHPEKFPEVFGISALPITEDNLKGLGYGKNDLLFFENVKVNDLAEGKDVVAYMVQSNNGSYAVSVGRVDKIVKNEAGDIEKIDIYVPDKSGTAGGVKSIAADSIQGKAIFSIKWVGGAVNFIAQPVGMVILVVIPIGLYFLMDLLKTTSERKKKDKEREKELEELRAKLGVEAADAELKAKKEAEASDEPEVDDPLYDTIERVENEAPVEEAPIEELAVEEAPAEEAPIEEAPVEEAPVEEAPVEEAPVEETDKTEEATDTTEE